MCYLLFKEGLLETQHTWLPSFQYCCKTKTDLKNKVFLKDGVAEKLTQKSPLLHVSYLSELIHRVTITHKRTLEIQSLSQVATRPG